MPAVKVLCVDDDRAVLQSLKDVLIHSGFEVTAVATVRAALELIGRQPFDVLLADLNIGEPGDGLTVVSAMRRVQPKACTFILTGYPDLESAIQAIRAQVDDYFAKPLEVPRLLDAIAAARAGTKRSITPKSPVTVAELVRQSSALICDKWLEETLKNPEIASLPSSKAERIDHIPDLLQELASRMEARHSESPTNILSEQGAEAARRHGRTRFDQGYSIPQILFEARVLQQVLSGAIQSELLNLELSRLVPDAFTVGESLEAAIELSIRAYQAQTPHSLQTSLSTLYRSPHLGVAIADESRIIDANDALLRMIQRTREQLMAGEIDWRRMTPEKYRPLDLNAIEQLREYGACVPFEKEFNLPDGATLPILIGAVRLSTDPFQWSVYMTDLTEQRRLQAAEAKVREWESKHLLINRLAHEINNPLAALVFTVHLLSTHELSEDARELVRNADQMLDRVDKVVRMVLAESRPAK
ncbi:MAG TPA: response regulator [Terracidiphilus sp.]|jgi:ActR/RegA family two-component response regulator|nr:response regulator [Terracidiphilus sp.]